jgi:hypothetical protein
MFGNQIVVGHSIMAEIDSLYKIEWKYKSSNFKSMTKIKYNGKLCKYFNVKSYVCYLRECMVGKNLEID